MAVLNIKCRDMPNMRATRITIWLCSPRNPWHPPMFPYREHQRDAGWYAVKALSDVIWTEHGKQAPQMPANAVTVRFTNPETVSSSSVSPTASGSLWTP